MKNKEELLAKLKNISMLVVEDGEDILNLIEHTFKLLAKEIKTATNGIEGLEILETFTPSIILTDIRMPKMNGSKMIEEIRARGLNIPIIVITGFKEELKCPQLVNRVFEKPINFASLLKAIDILVQ